MLPRESFEGPHMWHNRRMIPQDAQKVWTSHPPNPGVPRHAVPQARPQRVKIRRRSGFHPPAPRCRNSSFPEWGTLRV
jgi:hypothetical protein